MGRRLQITESIRISGVTPDEVWQLIRPAEAALFHPCCVEAYSEPGTGPGVGEIQRFTYQLDDDVREVVRSRVVAERAPYLAETEVLNSDPRSGSIFRLKRRRSATTLTHTVWIRARLGTYTVPVAAHHEYSAQFLAWVKESLESNTP